MNSRVSWSVDGIDPTVRERAEAAARRAGMSLNEWLNSTLGESAPPNFKNPSPPSSPARDVADIHQRLDAITSQIERISQPMPRNDGAREQGVARQLNDAISRLDARLSQISNPQAQRQAQNKQQRQSEAVERAASQVYAAASQPSQAYRNSPPLNPGSLDFAVAEIASRMNELDGSSPRAMPPRQSPPIAPVMAAPPSPGPDFSALERHLYKITSQIEALQRPDIESSIAAFRSELAEIRAAITEAMPRRAIDSIENEIRSLSRRIDDSRQSGLDERVLGNIENALNEIRDVLRSLKSAEQLAGYDEAIRNLGAKLDMILHASSDPGTVQQLEGAIAALRNIVSNVASNDALVRLSDDLQMLSTKVDQISRAGASSDSFAALESRIAALTSALEGRERPQTSDNSEQIETALRGLSDRIDRMQVGNDSSSAFAHLEQRVSYLLERLESSSGDQRSGNLSRVEDGLQDILRHLTNQQAALASLSNGRPRSDEPRDDGLIDLVKRELSDIRFSQTKTDRQTQDSLEAVHSTLGHVVDRLATIEGDLRSVRSAPVPPAAEPPVMSPRVAQPPQANQAPQLFQAPQPRPELPNPAATQAPHFSAAPREFHAVEPAAAVTSPPPPLAISEILVPTSAPRPPALAPDLPPDHPLEPGTRPGGRLSSPSERIAASESAISEIPSAPKEPVSSSSFIAAARRAAQAAAAAQPANDRAGRAAAKAKAKEAAKEAAKSKDVSKDGTKPSSSSTLSTRIRSLLVGASVVVIVLGTFKLAMNLLDVGEYARIPGLEKSTDQAPPPPPAAKTPAPDQSSPMPSLTSPTPIGKQSLNNAAPDPSATVAIPQLPAAPPAATMSDITGAIPHVPSAGQIPQGEQLPDQIGGPNLRAAALKGDPTAAYEVGVRFAEGKGVQPNLEQAAKWYDRAAKAGIIPAVFRLGTLYEKGMGVNKDVDTARRYYIQAAERGNAKAMHNLAVLDADGGGKGPDYKSAAQWFRKAADRGVPDSQFNLGILYARGIGVEQNLAESFKWFSLAAAQGDADAGHKRDDIAKRLDAQSLAAAKLAIQTFTAEPQPDDAINVAAPQGGWDSAPTAAAKPAAKPALTKRASR